MEDGADAALLVTPYYNKPPQEGLYQHHKLIADNVPLPQILYNVPGRTACDMMPETIERLSEFSNIVAVKEATGDLRRAEEIMKRCGERLDVISGDDATAMELILMGGKGDISVTANVAPAAMHEMCKAALAAVKAMEVPPDLTAPQFDRAFDLPEGRTISVAATQNGGMAPVGYVAPAASARNEERTGGLSSVKTHNGNEVVQINDTYSRALVLTDIILQRMKFNMVSRDEANGLFKVEYTGEEVTSSGKKKSFLKRLFKFKGSDNKLLAKGRIYQVKVINTGGKPLLRFVGESGKVISAEDNSKIINMINNEFNR
ncbi:4-hydroxy-tetrahydrodipicolinate synthase [Nymphon striatum]|nr:4-hydroxy-tetrahydrodipicolinate synthase [Nymphon striatum]